jgi:hypothetical protein
MKGKLFRGGGRTERMMGGSEYYRITLYIYEIYNETHQKLLKK